VVQNRKPVYFYQIMMINTLLKVNYLRIIDHTITSLQIQYLLSNFITEHYTDKTTILRDDN